MKRICAFLTVILLLLPLLASAQSLGHGTQRVFDYAELMSESEIAELEGLIATMRKQYNMDLVVLTSYDAKTDKSLAYADDFYDNNGFGAGDDFSGMLYFIDMKNRVPTISTTGLMIRYVTDARLDALLDTALIYLKDGKYEKSAYMTLLQLVGFIQDGIPSNQYNQDEYGNRDYYSKKEPSLTGGEIAIAVGAGLLCALALFFSVKVKYGLKGSTYKYDLNGNTTVNITRAEDVFVRSNVVRTRKQSSSGGGGGRSSTHTSSSGRSHGGGSGGKF